MTRVSSSQIFDAVTELAGHHRYALRPFLFMTLARPRLDLSTVEKAAAIQTRRLLERKVLSKIDTPSLDTWYEVSAEARAMTPNHSFQRTAYRAAELKR